MKLKIAVLAAVFAAVMAITAGTALASPPCPEPIVVQQPSGEDITVTLQGDEWFNWHEAKDGAVLKKGEDGYWRYAEYKDGKLSELPAKYGIDAKPAGAMDKKTLAAAVKKSQPVGAKAATQRSAAAIQRAGGIPTPDGPEPLVVLLISFSDISIQQTDSYWAGKMFADHHLDTTKTNEHSSVYDYFMEVSHGAFHFDQAAETSGTINDGIIRISLSYAHPAYPDSSQFDVDSRRVAADALTMASGSINFASFDADHNGSITPDELHIVMILAGYEQACGAETQAVWAHSFGLSSPLDLGVDVGSDYTQQGEIQQAWTGSSYIYYPATIGVLAHELGHSLGLPDLYDYGNDSDGLGMYSLMASGNWEYNALSNCYPGSSPAHLDAWCKYLLGFVVPATYTSGSHALNSISTGNYNVIKVPSTNPKQYFFLENRQNNYGYDKPLNWYFSTGGIAIYHIDEQVLDDAVSLYGGWYYINDDVYHKAVDMEEANQGILGYSQLDTENCGHLNCHHLFQTGDSQCNSSFNNSTTPSSKLYDNSASGVSVTVTSSSATSMNATVTGYNELTVTGLTPNKASPQREFRTIRWTCASSGGTNVTYKFDVKTGGSTVAGTGGYTASSYYDWTPGAAGVYTVTVSVLADEISVPIVLTSSDYTINEDTTNPVITATSGGASVPNGGYAKANVVLALSDADGASDDVVTGTYSYNSGSPAAIAPTGTTLTADGTYAASAQDLAGNTATLSFVIDKTLPVIQAICGTDAVADGQAVEGDVAVQATDANLSTFTATRNTISITWPTDGLFTGDGDYAVTASDLAGNVKHFSFAVDTAAPVVEASTGAGTITSGQIVNDTVMVSITEPHLATCTATRNGSTYPWPSNRTFTLEGDYGIQVTDTLGHMESCSFTIDKTNPAIGALAAGTSSLATGQATNAAFVAVNVTDTHLLGKIATKDGSAYSWPSENRFAEEGEYTITANDEATNESTFSFIIDQTPPVIQANAGAVTNGQCLDGNVTVAITEPHPGSKSVTRNGASYAWPLGGVFSAEGAYAVSCTDAAGNSAAFAFIIDKTYPSIQCKAGTANLTDGQYVSADVRVTITDTNITVRSITLDGGSNLWAAGASAATFTAEGTYAVVADDAAGHESAFTFTIDKTAPSIVATAGGPAFATGQAFASGTVVTVLVNDANFNTKTATRSGNAIEWPVDNQFSIDGSYIITAADRAGNSSVFRFGIYPNGDKLTLKTSPAGQYMLNGDVVTQNVAATVNDAGWTPSVTRNGAAYPAAWSGGAFTFTAEGAYRVTLAKDVETVSTVFTIDRTSPAISAKNPSGRAVAQGSVNKTAVTVTARDFTALTYSATRNGLNISWPAGGIFAVEGSYRATVRDSAGNVSTFTFTIDFYKPAFYAARADGSALFNKGYSNKNVTVTCSDAALASLTVKRDRRTYAWPSGGVFTLEGSYVITAKDRLGRLATFSFVIDKTAPVIRGAVNSGNYRSVTIRITEKYVSYKYATRNGVSIRWPGSRFRASGSYTVSVVDKAGNAKTLSFIVDAAKPSIAVTNLSGAAVRSGRTAYGGAIVTVSDAYLRSKSVKFGSVYLAWPSNNRFTAKGVYYITAYDVAGNKTTFKFYIK